MKTIILISLCFGAVSIFPQTYNMKIKQGTGSTYSATSTVDEITFLNTTTNPFACGDVILYGGETYHTVSIGAQCWMQENLNIGTMVTLAQADNGIVEKYCYNDAAANCVTYGGLYNREEAMQYVSTEGTKGICPVGWHIPTKAEFETLKSSVSSSGNSLKALGQGTDAGAGSNTSGFSALLAGYYSSGSNYNEIDLTASLRSSTLESGIGLFYTLFLSSGVDNISITVSGNNDGYSVRCIKD